MNKEFLPKGYELPKSKGGYTKFEEGKTKLRILSAPLLGWVDWTEEDGKKKPVRFAYDKMPETSFDSSKPVRHFWAFKVWNYKTKSVQIWEVTQSGIQAKIATLAESEAWGSPVDYDIEVVREGMGFNDTNYEITPFPHKDLIEDIVVEIEKVKVDLDKLLAGLDPFAFEPTSEEESTITADEVGF